MNKRIIIIILPFIVHTSFGQFKTLSSASEAGRINSSVFSQNKFAGELSAAYSGHLVVNFQNPASYADASLTSIEAGVYSLSGSYQITDSSYSSGGLGINHFAYQMPLTVGKSGMSFGVLRSSNTNYNIKTNGSDPQFGSFYNEKSGNGNKYLIYIGTGFRFEKFKIGGNLGINFGQVEYHNDIVFPDSTYLPRLTNRNFISEFGLEYTLGTQYEIDPKKDEQVILGAYYKGNISKSGTNEFKQQNVFTRTTSYEYITLKDSTFSVDLPMYSKYGFGISWIRKKTLLLGTEFNYENYGDFKSTLTNQNLQNAWHIHFGAEYKPFMNRDINTRKYFNRLTYRFGSVIGKSEQNFDGSLNDIKFMGSATLPVFGRNLGYMTIGAEYGIRGFGGNINQLSENTFAVHLIVTFAEKWFIRQKFD